MTDPISQQQLITGGGKGDPVYIDDVFNPYLWVGSGSGAADSDFQPSGIQFNNSNKGESVEFHYGVGGSGGDYLLTPSSSDYSVGAGAYTLEYWMYTAFTATHQIVDARMNGESYTTNWCTYTNTSNQHILFVTGADRITSNTTLNDNTWYHIAIVRDSAGLHKMFIDGVQQTQTYSDTQNFPSTQLTIGSYGPNRSSSSFDGHLSNLRFVKGTAVYTSNFTPPTENLTNITNTKLLCCQSSVSATIAAVGSVSRPGNINDTQASTFGPFTGEDAEGGMVWIKNRENSATHNILVDSVRGSTNYLIPNTDSPSSVGNDIVPIMSFGGFSVGNNGVVNEVNKKIVSWSFGKKKNFFDIVTWNGNATNRTIAHNLGSVPGCIFIKRTDVAANWMVYHRKANNGVNPANYQQHLNTTAAEAAAPTVFNNTEPTATEFSVGTHYDVNGNGGTFVAYLFAHDQASFGENSNQSIIACDNYTGNGSGGESGPDINIGWQPQWIMIKPADTAGENWLIFDTMRGIGEDPANDYYLRANTTGDEQRTSNWIEVSSTGFKLTDGTGSATNANGVKYIYIAIRGRDGLVCKPPSVGSDVFSVNVGNGAGTNQGFPTFYSGFPVDMGLFRQYQANESWYLMPRLFNGYYLRTNLTSSRASYGTMARQDSNIGWGETSSWDSNYMAWMWKRYAGFDMIPYLGDGNAGRTLSHSMGTVPEMIWVKNAHGSSDWAVYHAGVNDGTTPQNYSLRLDHDGAYAPTDYWNDTAPTKTQITLGTSVNVNGNGDDYLAMVFSSVEGISKCGYYSGSASDTTVDLGFTPRFLMIKSANSTGDWLVFDYYRGLASDTAGWGEAAFTTHGTTTWTAPAGVTSVNVVCVGGGGCGNLYHNGYNTGGGGGGLGWKNNISVTPGQQYTVRVGQGGQRSYNGGPGGDGQDSYFIDTSTVRGGGGFGAAPNNPAGGDYTGDGGGNGGRGGNVTNKNPVGSIVGGGGGAGGYSGNGGNAGGNNCSNINPCHGQAGSGGAGGGGKGAGGGVGIFGEGASGAQTTSGAGNPGSGGIGKVYGGGGEYWDPGGDGAVRIMWGSGRAFPSTNAGLDGADPYMPLNLDTKQTDASVIKTIGASSITLAGNQPLTNAQNAKYIYYAHA